VLTKRLTDAKEEVLKIATNLATLQYDCGLNISIKDYLKVLNWGLVEVVYEWARGMVS